MHDCNECGNHALISCNEVIEKLPALVSLTLHIIRNCCREVVVLVLLSLPIRDIGLNGKELVFALPDSLVGGDGTCINGKHKTSVDVGKLCHKAVLNKVCVITQVHHSAVSSVHHEVVGTKLKAVGSDGILEAIPSPFVKTCIEVKIFFTSVMEEIEEDTKLFFSLHFLYARAERSKQRGKFCSYSAEITSRFLQTALFDSDSQVFVLHDTVRLTDILGKNVVILGSVSVKHIPLKLKQAVLLKLLSVHTAVVDCDFGICLRIKRVEYLRIGKKHSLFILS